MFKITRADLDRLCPRPKAGTAADIWDKYATALENIGPALRAAGMTDNIVLCHALAQWAHESDGFTILWESGNYSAKGIMRTFGVGKHSARVTEREAREIAAISTAGDQRAYALFERVYGLGNPAKAKELGNTDIGDGYRHRGFGIGQITGRHDHELYLGNVYTADNSINAAIQEWVKKGCTTAARADNCKVVTKLINGGYNGLEARELLLRQAKQIWLDAEDKAVTAVAALDGAARDSHLRLVVDTDDDGVPDAEEVLAGSRKAATLGTQEKVAIGTAALAATPTIADTVGSINGTLEPLKGLSALIKDLARDHVVLILVVVAVLVYFGAKQIKSYMRQDVEEGRYTPRG